MAGGPNRFREYCESIVDWTCIEKLPLRKFIYCIATFDFFWSLFLFSGSAMAHFLYVNPAGRSSFLHYKYVNHVDIYKFRRYQPWELAATIDWNEDLRYINQTRYLLDLKCSRYKHQDHIPGDPGDYLKEVAGRPYTSGYNERLALVVRLWVGSVVIVYLSTPSLLLAIWWRKRRVRIIIVYMFIQMTPLALMISIGGIMGEPLMCATNVAYGQKPMRDYFHALTIWFTVYQFLKFLILSLYMVERLLIERRKDYGFPTHKIVKRTVRVAPLLEEKEEEEDDSGWDADGEDEEEENDEQFEARARRSTFVPLKKHRPHKSLAALNRVEVVVVK